MLPAQTCVHAASASSATAAILDLSTFRIASLPYRFLAWREPEREQLRDRFDRRFAANAEIARRTDELLDDEVRRERHVHGREHEPRLRPRRQGLLRRNHGGKPGRELRVVRADVRAAELRDVDI